MSLLGNSAYTSEESTRYETRREWAQRMAEKYDLTVDTVLTLRRMLSSYEAAESWIQYYLGLK